jgi:hypothetical protein
VVCWVYSLSLMRWLPDGTEDIYIAPDTLRYTVYSVYCIFPSKPSPYTRQHSIDLGLFDKSNVAKNVIATRVL